MLNVCLKRKIMFRINYTAPYGRCLTECLENAYNNADMPI